MAKRKVKFRDMKSRCRDIVKTYREETEDWRAFPQFNIGCLSKFARRGHIQLTRKAKGEEPVFSNSITYNSFGELALIMESLGNAWASTNP
ncbi:MAG: hypothetical protein JRN06_09080 [Nitrososphaerota archaeon]|nr:hypothetical protein [Nitrososphaerota archaeon]